MTLKQTKLPTETLVRKLPPKRERMLNALRNPLIIQRELNNRSLFEFVRYFWPEYSNDEFVPNWHIPFLCQELEKIAYRVGSNKHNNYDLIINVPPGTTKTALVSIFFPIWCWTRFHWFKFITASYSAELSLESAEYSRDIMRSQKFKELYPDLQLKPDKDTKSNFKLIKKVFQGRRNPKMLMGGNRFSTSVGGTVTGFHGHINIVDDPTDPRKVLSEKELASTNHWMSQVLPMRKANKNTTTTIIIMQRLHQNDPTGFLLSDPKKAAKIKHICLPGEIRTFRDMVNPPEAVKYYKDDLLDPIRMPWKVMNDMKTDLGQYGYAGQVGQKPTPPGGGMFHVDQFQIIDKIPNPKLIEQIVRYWDKAATADAGAYTAGVKMARLRGNKYVILDVKRGQWSADKREKIIKSTIQADGVECFQYIEQEPGSGGKESAELTIRNNLGYHVEADRPIGDKVYRADPFSVQVNEGNVWLIRAEWNKDFIDEFEFFPFSTYKDQVDASSGAYAKLMTKKRIKVI